MAIDSPTYLLYHVRWRISIQYWKSTEQYLELVRVRAWQVAPIARVTTVVLYLLNTYLALKKTSIVIQRYKARHKGVLSNTSESYRLQ